MHATTCRLCGASVLWYIGPDKKVPLDAHEVHAGVGRLAVTPEGLVEIPAAKQVAGYTDHRETCPYYARHPNFR